MKKPLLFIFAALSFINARAQFSGNALDFDGSNDIVNIASVPSVFTNPATSDFTIESWVNPRGSIFARILFAQASTTNFVSLGTSTGNVIYFYVIKNGTTVSVATTAGIPQNQWTHVTARWTSATSTAEVFFNGVLQAGVAGGSSSTGTNGLTSIGARTGGSQFFNGQLDELRVWSTALSLCDIQANMNNTIPTTQANLIMNYNFNQGVAGATNTTVTALPDLSGNTYDGTLSSFALTGATSNWVSSTATVTASGYSSAAISAVTSQTNIACNGAANGTASVTVSGTGPFTYTWTPAGGNAATATGLSAGTYTVGITNSCGSTTKTLSISQPAAIVLSPVASPTAICAGNATTLTAGGSGGTGALTFTWSTGVSSGTTAVTPTSTTVYTLNAADANGCTKSATLGITVNALPSVSLTASSSTICSNSVGSITLTGSPAGGTYSGANVAGNVFTPTGSGTFTPAYSFTNTTTGCTAAATTTLQAFVCMGIASADGNAAPVISVYPNPGNGLFTVDLLTEAELSVMNVTGAEVLAAEKMEAGKHKLDLSGEAAGIYFVRVMDNGKPYILKLVKQ